MCLKIMCILYYDICIDNQIAALRTVLAHVTFQLRLYRVVQRNHRPLSVKKMRNVSVA